MGAKDSKRACLSYEDAVKRVSDAELKRINEAFKRLSGGGQLMSQSAFTQHVLGEGVPLPVAGWLYAACGGTPRGIALKDLVCGLVLLTKGTYEEKIRFLWTLYCNDSGTHINKSDFQRALQLENSSPHTSICNFQATASSLFVSGHDRATYEEFRGWIGHNTSATVLSRWLLTEPCVSLASTTLDTLTFYQTLAGVTHLEERDICDLEKCFWLLQSTSSSGQLDVQCVSQLVSPPVPATACEGLFKALDVNRDSHVDFKELCCGVSAACRGPVGERVKFCFKMFDLDRDGRLNDSELRHMLDVLIFVAKDHQSTSHSQQSKQQQLNHAEQEHSLENLLEPAENSSLQLITELEQSLAGLRNHLIIEQQKWNEKSIDLITGETQSLKYSLYQEEFVIWAVPNTSLVHPTLELLFQVCHVSLGLRPRCRHHEKDIVTGWLDREERRGYKVGQFWYLISSEWWRNWLSYTAYQQSSGHCHGCGQRAVSPAQNSSADRSVEEGIACDESFTSNSTESMGDLLRGSNHFINSDRSNFNGNNSGGDTCSIASSSGVSSSSGSGTTTSQNISNMNRKHPSAPGPIDNTALVVESQWKVGTLTGEGGRLRRDRALVQHRDFELIPDSLWKALAHWYGGPLPLPRQVIKLPGADEVDLELYPFNLRILRHQQQNSNSSGAQNMATNTPNTWGTVVGGYGAAALSSAGLTAPPQLSPRRYLAHTAAFSRLATIGQVLEFLSQRLSLRTDDLRVWHIRESHHFGGSTTNSNSGNGSSVTSSLSLASSTSSFLSTSSSSVNSNSPLILLDDDRASLQDIGIKDGDQVLLEVRNADLTWPEELGALVAGAKHQERAPQAVLPAGATGLHNLGNTCFMNAALQAVSSTKPLTMYFRRDARLCELNQSNPLGTRGQVARRYAELCRELWTGTARSVAPLKLRWCVARHAPHLGGGGQHDSQELLAWLLDALHEDLNRVTGKRYTELSDSAGRPDAVVAAEAWKQHLARDHSIITDLFYGQLKSKVTCQVCGHESVRFDPFNVLSLPLPMDSYTLCEILVVRLDGSIPVRYGIRLNSDARYSELKERLQKLCGVQAYRLILAEVGDSQIRAILQDSRKVKASTSLDLMAYELDGCVFQTNNGDGLVNGDLTPVISSKLRATSVADSGDPIMVPSPPGSPRQAARSPETASVIRHSVDQPLSSLALRHLQSSLEGASRRCSSPITSTGSHNNPNHISAIDYITAVHRKCVRQDAYFVAQHKTRPVLFGVPLLLACGPNTSTQQLYEAVWTQVTRLLSPLPQSDQTNHATDCDDSLGYEFPFTLRTVSSNGQICALCPWTKFCRGCPLPCGAELIREIYQNNNYSNNIPTVTPSIAIDWDPTALHLRYQSTRERQWIEHESVAICRKLHTEPVDLDHCLRAFTSEESLETKYHCSACNDKQPATKKLQIWRLPPVLIIHLKRFDYVNAKWVKTHKVVNFPFNDFDPTSYLASVPQETILRHRQLRNNKHNLQKIPPAPNNSASNNPNNENIDCNIILKTNNNNNNANNINNPDASTETGTEANAVVLNVKNEENDEITDDDEVDDLNGSGIPLNGRRNRLESTSLLRTPILDENLEDFHMHHLVEGQNPFELKYQLYAVVSHSGMLNGGHYVSYACNPNGNWYCYNDSSCREVRITDSTLNGNSLAPRMDTSSAYMLFYERSGLDYAPYLPDVPSGGAPLEAELEDGESELRKQLCNLS